MYSRGVKDLDVINRLNRYLGNAAMATLKSGSIKHSRSFFPMSTKYEGYLEVQFPASEGISEFVEKLANAVAGTVSTAGHSIL
jgi:hypothetical protein